MAVVTEEQRVIKPISDRELERRWRLTREAMAHAGLDAIVMRQADDWLGGYTKWFTDVPATGGYGTAVIFHAVDFMTVIHAGAFGGKRDLKGKDPANRGVGEMISTSPFSSAHYTSMYEAQAACEVLRHRGYKTIGLLGRGYMPYDFVRGLEEGLGGNVRMIDASDIVDPIKAVKSDEEIGFMRETAAMQDRVLATVLTKIRPGMRDIDVTALAQYEGMLVGSEQGVLNGSSARLGQPAVFRRRHFQARRMEKGDHMTLLIENNGPGGYYTELARTIVLGKETSELAEGTEAAREAQAYTAAGLRPGRECREIYEAHNAFMTQHGLPPEKRLFCHGQGYDLVERPLVRFDETMSIGKNMCFPIHPGIHTASVYINLCDNFLVREDGTSECLHKTEKKVFEVQ